VTALSAFPIEKKMVFSRTEIKAKEIDKWLF